MTSPGRLLDPVVRENMESRFGYDFSSVKIHTDPTARESANAARALAYTVNSDIVLGPRAPREDSPAGQRLLAHELAHIVQRHETGTVGVPQPSQADNDADRIATEFADTELPLRVMRTPPAVLARQAIPGSQPTAPKVEVTAESGRTVVLVNGVPIAETKTAVKDVVVYSKWTPDGLGVRVLVPDGQDVFLIRSAQATAALQAAATQYRVDVGNIVTAQAPKGELDTPGPGQSLRITDSMTGERPKPPARKPTLPPKTPPPPPKPPETASPAPVPSPTPSGPPIQLFRPSTPSLDLPPEARYGKRPAEYDAAEQRIRGIVRDAMAGKPSIPPPIAGVDKVSLLDLAKRVVADAVKPLIGGLPKDMQKLVLDKLDGAVESGVKGALESALDATKLDAVTKGAILRAADAGMRVK
ncbi:DUF4157 domain-containing protein [Mycolicibacterium rufum]|uniref:DUF4157 domain-containing protein n=2 Tax=Mycolicibacterium rufum TaxID=318424 RepID=A0ABY3UEE3_9MYCO|nr:DUF4157 domain-containing protein [Mycolicibacterium rufum]ULP38004.1 DUF4157 domain-containing protein [Mycolicibacterium rufum]